MNDITRDDIELAMQTHRALDAAELSSQGVQCLASQDGKDGYGLGFAAALKWITTQVEEP